MSIVSHSLESSPEANGGAHNVLRMLDHNGLEYMASFYTTATDDVNAIITTLKARMEITLANSEADIILSEEL